MWSSERRRWLAAAALLPWVPLAGCGFELRRPPPMPFSTVALTGFAPRSPLAAELKQALAQSTRVVEAPADAQVVVHAMSDARERSVVASTAAAQVREFQLRLKLQFRAATPGGKELIAPVELLLQRDLSYSETAALAKEQEADELFREMQTDIVGQVLRRLAAIRMG